MYAVYGGRTERSAKFQPPKEKPKSVNIIEVRRLKRLEQIAIEREKREAMERLFRDRVKQANDAIRRANDALAAFREGNLIYNDTASGSIPISFDDIMDRICKATGITRRDILSERRAVDVVFARQAVCYWAYRRTKLSFPEIAKAMGRSDHTTTIHSVAAYVEKRAKEGRTLPDARTCRGRRRRKPSASILK